MSNTNPLRCYNVEPIICHELPILAQKGTNRLNDPSSHPLRRHWLTP
jgi:hypothetical protein